MDAWLRLELMRRERYPARSNTRSPLENELEKQIFWSRLLSPVTYILVWLWMKCGRRYSMPQIGEVRREFKKLAAESPRPWLICSNHLTLIDSFILLWALGGVGFYLRHPERFAWNLPEKMNFYHNPLSRLLCYLGKCIPVIRGGPHEHTKATREKVNRLVGLGHSIMIFPEGTRSRSGKIQDRLESYASGAILSSNPELRVLCVYLRGANQFTYSDFPTRGETFSIAISELHTKSSTSGLKGQRDLSNEIIVDLKRMEKEYEERCAVDRK